jgi:hypothetical protein
MGGSERCRAVCAGIGRQGTPVSALSRELVELRNQRRVCATCTMTDALVSRPYDTQLLARHRTSYIAFAWWLLGWMKTRCSQMALPAVHASAVTGLSRHYSYTLRTRRRGLRDGDMQGHRTAPACHRMGDRGKLWPITEPKWNFNGLAHEVLVELFIYLFVTSSPQRSHPNSFHANPKRQTIGTAAPLPCLRILFLSHTPTFFFFHRWLIHF